MDTIEEESSPMTSLPPLTPSMDMTPIPEEPPISTLHQGDDMDGLYDTPPTQPFSSKWVRHYMFTAAIAIGTTPVHYRDVKKLTQSEQKEWQKLMEEEMKSLHDQKVWELVDLPPGRKPITGRWIYAMKSDGCKKVQFIAKGFTQIYGIDFEETFSPIAHFETVHLLLALAALEDWEIKALNVKTAFLFGELDDNEQLYMTQPEGFFKKRKENKVC
jgi:hypothetical protein